MSAPALQISSLILLPNHAFRALLYSQTVQYAATILTILLPTLLQLYVLLLVLVSISILAWLLWPVSVTALSVTMLLLFYAILLTLTSPSIAQVASVMLL